MGGFNETSLRGAACAGGAWRLIRSRGAADSDAIAWLRRAIAGTTGGIGNDGLHAGAGARVVNRFATPQANAFALN